MSTTPLTPSPQVIMARCDIAEEDLDAYRRDEKAAIAERVAATACLVLVDGLRTITPVDDISARWHSVLHVLEALRLADTVGRPAAHVYRSTYRALAGTYPAQEG